MTPDRSGAAEAAGAWGGGGVSPEPLRVPEVLRWRPRAGAAAAGVRAAGPDAMAPLRPAAAPAAGPRCARSFPRSLRSAGTGHRGGPGGPGEPEVLRGDRGDQEALRGKGITGLGSTRTGRPGTGGHRGDRSSRGWGRPGGRGGLRGGSQGTVNSRVRRVRKNSVGEKEIVGSGGTERLQEEKWGNRGSQGGWEDWGALAWLEGFW